MKCFAQAIDLNDDPRMIAEYEAHHRHAWPEVLEALRSIGIHRMRIFRLGTRLFMYAEARDDFDPQRDYQAYAADPRCRAWDELMRRYQRQVPTAPSEHWWATMHLVFDLEGSEQP